MGEDIDPNKYVQFAIETQNHQQVQIQFYAYRNYFGPSHLKLFYSSNANGPFTDSGQTFSPVPRQSNPFGLFTFDFTGLTSTTGITYFRIYPYYASKINTESRLFLEDVAFTGCGIIQAPALSIVKRVAETSYAAVGDILHYSYQVTNSGNATLAGPFTVADDKAVDEVCPVTASLAPGASITCTAIYTVTQADINAGSVTNIASASNGTITSATDSKTVTATQSPHLGLTKLATEQNFNASGVLLHYRLAATNDGNVTLTGVSITDTQLGALNCSPAQPTSLAPSAILSCTGTYLTEQADVDAGKVDNSAYANGLLGGTLVASDAVSETVTADQLPVLTLVKSASLATYDAVGETISYSYLMTNAGNVTLAGPFTVSDDKAVDEVCPVTASLAPGASITCTAIYTVTQADINAGSVTNIASASNGTITSATDSKTVTATQSPHLGLTKLATEQNFNAAGVLLHYRLAATNDGNVTLTDVGITDTQLGALNCSPAQPTSLAPSAILSCTGTYLTEQADVDAGKVDNSAYANGLLGGTLVASDAVSETVTADQLPVLTLVKSASLATYDAVGETISYSYLVTNAGNVTLAGPFTVSDDKAVDESCPVTASLAPGASITCSASYTVSQADLDAGSVTNSATATGGAVTSQEVTVSVAALQNPNLIVTKTVTSSGPYDLGDMISYWIEVRNTGNITLSNIRVEDPTAAKSYCSAFTGILLAPGVRVGCSASHIVTQEDVDAGRYTNTVTAKSDQSQPATDDTSVEIAQTAAIQLEKTGSLSLDTTAPAGVLNAGDTIRYAFTLTNTGTATLMNIDLEDTVDGVTLSGGQLNRLAPGEHDDSTFTATYTLTQADIEVGSFTNTAMLNALSPQGRPVSATGEDTQTLAGAPVLGLAMRLVSAPVLVSPGTWELTFEMLVRNYGNLTIEQLQVEDNLADAFSLAAPFTVQALSSPDFAVNGVGFNGVSDTHLLTGSDSLAVGAQGKITLVVRVVPAMAGPFENMALASGQTHQGIWLADHSQAGNHPDPDMDGNPENNDEPTPVDFGPNLFEAPLGIKRVDETGLSTLRWGIAWINNANIVALNAASSDALPIGTIFDPNGAPSGYPLPAGDLPVGTTTGGVTCQESSPITATQYCYYEGPTSAYPRGRVIWQGRLGADFEAADPAAAAHKIQIRFNTWVNSGVEQVDNTAVLDVDLNGDGDVEDSGERNVSKSNAVWRVQNLPWELPVTGFAAGRITALAEQPASGSYVDRGLVLKIPTLGVSAPIVGVPLTEAGWPLDWLGSQVGHLEGTAFPTWNGNSALTAHVYDANGQPGPFVSLGDLRWGDAVLVEGWGQRFIYEVRTVQTRVDPADAGVLAHENRPWLTLITCQGYDETSNSYRWRMVVRAVLVRVE